MKKKSVKKISNTNPHSGNSKPKLGSLFMLKEEKILKTGLFMKFLKNPQNPHASKIGLAADYNKTGKAHSPTLLEYLF